MSQGYPVAYGQQAMTPSKAADVPLIQGRLEVCNQALCELRGQVIGLVNTLEPALMPSAPRVEKPQAAQGPPVSEYVARINALIDGVVEITGLVEACRSRIEF